MISRTFLTAAGAPAPHRGVYVEPLILPPDFVPIVTFSVFPILSMDFQCLSPLVLCLVTGPGSC